MACDTQGDRIMSIARDSLLSLEAYARERPELRARVIPHRRLRTVDLGSHVTLHFEDEMTVRYQIQEMLRVERIFEEDGIRAEIDVYGPLVPDGTNWKATMLIENTEKTSAVHFLRFELAPQQIAALKAGANLDMGVDHEHYEARSDVAAATRAALVADLR